MRETIRTIRGTNRTTKGNNQNKKGKTACINSMPNFSFCSWYAYIPTTRSLTGLTPLPSTIDALEKRGDANGSMVTLVCRWELAHNHYASFPFLPHEGCDHILQIWLRLRPILIKSFLPILSCLALFSPWFTYCSVLDILFTIYVHIYIHTVCIFIDTHWYSLIFILLSLRLSILFLWIVPFPYFLPNCWLYPNSYPKHSIEFLSKTKLSGKSHCIPLKE